MVEGHRPLLSLSILKMDGDFPQHLRDLRVAIFKDVLYRCVVVGRTGPRDDEMTRDTGRAAARHRVIALGRSRGSSQTCRRLSVNNRRRR